jgi:integrase
MEQYWYAVVQYWFLAQAQVMSSLHHDPKTGIYRIRFRFGGRQHHYSLRTNVEAEARNAQGGIEEMILAIEKGLRPMPSPENLWAVLFSSGRVEEKPSLPEVFTLEQLFGRYESEMPPGAMEANSLETLRFHRNHLLRLLGKRKPVMEVKTADLQRYINQRLGEFYRGKSISTRTIKKEVATFRAVWNWAVVQSLVTGVLTFRGLKYAKENEKLHFMTWTEIEQRVARTELPSERQREFWDCLFLDAKQIEKVLTHVKDAANRPFIYPMFVFVAHTGARRSEMIRSEVDDIDLGNGEVVLREKKRDREKKLTYRRVPMSDLLKEVMQRWLCNDHPGGIHTFCRGDVTVTRRRKHYPGVPAQAPLTTSDADYAFNRTLAGSKWSVIKGFHVFRHSFASNLAYRGIDQRVIDEMLGHQTEEMRRRYRHLFPEQRVNAIKEVFGSA